MPPILTSVSTEEEVIDLVPGRAAPPPHPPPRRPMATTPMRPEPLSVRADLPARFQPARVLSDIMSRHLIAVDEHEPLGDLEGGMKRFRFHHLLVVSGGKRLVGLITRSDFLHAALGTNPNGKPTDVAVDAKTVAGAIMRRTVITAKMDTPIETACRVLLSEKIGCLPVVLEDATLVGIVTESDMVRVALEVLERTKH